jgi:hypothetical protein
VDINGAIGRLPLRLKCRVLYLPRRDDGEDGSTRNEAETDGAGPHQLGPPTQALAAWTALDSAHGFSD